MRPRKQPSGLEDVRRKAQSRREGTDRLAAAPTPQDYVRNDLGPDLKLAVRQVDDLKVGKRQLHKLDEARVREIAAPIAALGVCAPITIDKDNRVIDGHARLAAAKFLGMTEIQCIVVSHLSQAERRLLALALNRLPQTAVWDLPTLKLEFQELIAEGQPLEVAGWSMPEIDLALQDEEPQAIEDGPLEPSEEPPVSWPGDGWWIGAHAVLCGDARDLQTIADMFGERRARLVLTDVPYNVKIRGNVTKGRHREFVMASGEMSEGEYLDLISHSMEVATILMLQGGILATFIDWRGLHTVESAARALGLAQLNLICWAKSNAGMGSLYRSQHELLPIYKLGDAPHVNNINLGKHGRSRSNVWRYAGASAFGSDAREGLKLHPTVKPQVMLEEAILDLTNRGELVFDPFLGSGSTLMAAEATGRVCAGVELDPRYVDVILERWMRKYDSEPILAATGQTYSEVRRERSERRHSRRPPSDTPADYPPPTTRFLSSNGRGR